MRASRIVILLLTVIIVILLARGGWQSRRSADASVAVRSGSGTLQAATAISSKPQSHSPATAFAIAESTSTHHWALVDGRDTNVIRRLAHNDLEYARMVEENPRIERRQLVYRADTAAAVVQRARLSGAPVTRLTLPGLDGREIDFQIQKADLNPSGQSGIFTGVAADKPDSLVTLAFKGGREAFTIELPSEKLYLLAEPHEPGEIIVKKIDPETYVPAPCGNP